MPLMVRVPVVTKLVNLSLDCTTLGLHRGAHVTVKSSVSPPYCCLWGTHASYGDVLRPRGFFEEMKHFFLCSWASVWYPMVLFVPASLLAQIQVDLCRWIEARKGDRISAEP